jgi:hypothetical protein
VRRRAAFIAAAVGLAVAFVPAVRLLNGLDPLTGDDPKTIAASRGNPDLEFTFMRTSFTAYEVRDRASAVKGYFQLENAEILAGPMQVAPCGAGGGLSVPAWLPRFPNATEWVCIRTATSAGERRHVSFITAEHEIEAAWAFYEAALEKLPNTGGGSSRSVYPAQGGTPSRSTPLWRGTHFRSDERTGWRVSIQYLFYRPGTEPFVTIAFTDGR